MFAPLGIVTVPVNVGDASGAFALIADALGMPDTDRLTSDPELS